MKAYYWVARRPKRRSWPGLVVALAGTVVAFAAVGYWIFQHGLSSLPGLAHLPGIPSRLPEPPGWARFVETPGPAGAVVRIGVPQPVVSGAVGLACSPLPPAGVQIALHTGAQALPVVAVRFASLPATGTAGGEIYLTGRDAAGALVGATGRATFTPSRRERSPDGLGEILAGTIRGTFHGPAGQGEIEARLRGCATAPPPPGVWGRLPVTATAIGGAEEN